MSSMPSRNYRATRETSPARMRLSSGSSSPTVLPRPPGRDARGAANRAGTGPRGGMRENLDAREGDAKLVQELHQLAVVPLLLALLHRMLSTHGCRRESAEQSGRRERPTGLEPVPGDWKSPVLPLHHGRARIA